MKDNAVYLEADEDITSAIDKLQKTEGSAVQIVVPKRSTMLQSIINLKLLKKAMQTAGKELVLVTNDKIATDLAARVGLAVAPSLGAKPVISQAQVPETLKNHEEIIEDSDPEPPQVAEPVAVPAKPKRPLLKRRDVSDEPLAAVPVAAAATPDDGGKPPRVPNFNQLQRRLVWAALAVCLIVGYFAFMFFYGSAKVVLYASGTKLNVNTTFAVDTAAKASDQSGAVLAGQTVTVSKDLTGSFAPTGKKDAGTKAGGQVTMYNEYDISPHTLVAGTQLVAPDGKVFRTKSDVNVPGATVGLSGGKFTLNPGKSDPVPVEADQNGDTYNEAPAKYTVKNYTGDMQAKIYGQGAQMSGGTTKNVTVVAQSDVDTAKADIVGKDKDNALRDLKAKLPAGYTALDASAGTRVDSADSAPAVDAEAATATLTVKVTYTLLAVPNVDYKTLVRAQELKQVGAGNQIYDDGLAGAEVTTGDKDGQGRPTFHLSAEAFSGKLLDTNAVANALKGQRYGDAMSAAKGYPGVTQADIEVKPGWSTNLPSRASKIKVSIKVSDDK